MGRIGSSTARRTPPSCLPARASGGEMRGRAFPAFERRAAALGEIPLRGRVATLKAVFYGST